MDEFADIIYDRNKFTPPPERLLLLRKSKEEAALMESRVIRCPICQFRCLVGYERAMVHVQFRCSKCKFESPINLAYFRTQRDRKRVWGKREDISKRFAR